MFLRTRCAKLKMRELVIQGCPYWGLWGVPLSAENLLNPLYHHFVASFLRQIFENCKDGNDMGLLEVVMHSEIQFFSSLLLYTFLWG